MYDITSRILDNYRAARTQTLGAALGLMAVSFLALQLPDIQSPDVLKATWFHLAVSMGASASGAVLESMVVFVVRKSEVQAFKYMNIVLIIFAIVAVSALISSIVHLVLFGRANV